MFHWHLEALTKRATSWSRPCWIVLRLRLLQLPPILGPKRILVLVRIITTSAPPSSSMLPARASQGSASGLPFSSLAIRLESVLFLILRLFNIFGKSSFQNWKIYIVGQTHNKSIFHFFPKIYFLIFLSLITQYDCVHIILEIRVCHLHSNYK